MITKFLSQPINVNLLIILITYAIVWIAWDENTTAFEILTLFFLLTFNNILMYIRGMARVIFDNELKKEFDRTK